MLNCPCGWVRMGAQLYHLAGLEGSTWGAQSFRPSIWHRVGAWRMRPAKEMMGSYSARQSPESDSHESCQSDEQNPGDVVSRREAWKQISLTRLWVQVLRRYSSSKEDKSKMDPRPRITRVGTTKYTAACHHKASPASLPGSQGWPCDPIPKQDILWDVCWD